MGGGLPLASMSFRGYAPADLSASPSAGDTPATPPVSLFIKILQYYKIKNQAAGCMPDIGENMKKLFNLAAAGLIFALVLGGCSKNQNKREVRKPSAQIDSTAWIDNLIDGKAAAAKENKKIFLFFSGDDQDKSSAELKEAIFNTSDFMDELLKSYVLVNLDFSASLFDKAAAEPDASEEEKAAAAELWVKLEENMRDAGIYNIQETPAFFLATKEGYVITQVVFEKKPESAAQVLEEISALEETVAEYENTLTSCRTGKTEDRLTAINKLFDMTEPQLRYLLTDLSSDYIKLDKKNRTGMCGAHVVAMANANAVQFYLDQDPASASEEFAKAASSKYLTPDQKQQCYYTAGYLFAQSGTDDYPKIKDYFEKAYEADPSSPYAETIQSMMRMMEERYLDAPAPEAETAPEAPAENPEAPAQAEAN